MWYHKHINGKKLIDDGIIFVLYYIFNYARDYQILSEYVCIDANFLACMYIFILCILNQQAVDLKAVYLLIFSHSSGC